MKRLWLIFTLTGLFALGAYQVRAILPQDSTSTRDNKSKAHKDAKDAGHDTTNAAKKTGGAVK